MWTPRCFVKLLLVNFTRKLMAHKPVKYCMQKWNLNILLSLISPGQQQNFQRKNTKKELYLSITHAQVPQYCESSNIRGMQNYLDHM